MFESLILLYFYGVAVAALLQGLFLTWGYFKSKLKTAEAYNYKLIGYAYSAYTMSYEKQEFVFSWKQIIIWRLFLAFLSWVGLVISLFFIILSVIDLYRDFIWYLQAPDIKKSARWLWTKVRLESKEVAVETRNQFLT